MALLCFDELGLGGVLRLGGVGDLALTGGILIGFDLSVLGTSSTSIFGLSDNVSISMSKGTLDALEDDSY